MNLFTLKEAANALKVSKKEVKGILIDRGIITASEAPADTPQNKGFVAEICVHFPSHVETHLRLTNLGFLYLVEEVYHG